MLGRRGVGGQRKGPVIIFFRQPNQAGIGLFQLNPRQINGSGKQRQRRQGGFNSRQMHHSDLRDRRRVAENNIFGMDVRPGDPAPPAALARLALPDNAEVAANRKRTIQLG